MNYNVYLQGEHWKLMRRLRREVDNEKCAVCGSRDKLNVHHKTYERIGAEKLGDLITLCYECHGKYHDKLGKGNFSVQQKNTIESFQKKEDLSGFKVEEDYAALAVTNKTFDDYDLHLDGKMLGTIPNQRTVSSIRVPSGLREFVFRCGEKEKKRVETIRGSAKIDISYSKEKLEDFVKELWNTNFKNPLTIENKNILTKVLGIKEIFPLLEHSAFMNLNLKNTELVKLLISKEYNLNSNTRYGETPLETCAKLNNAEDIYFLLLNSGAKPTKKTLEYALGKANKRVIESLLNYVEFEPKFIYEIIGNRNEGVLELLLEKEVDINYKYPSYNYPIHHFITKNRWDVLEKLIAANVNKEALTTQDETPFLLALKTWRNESRAMDMLNLGFSPLGADTSGMTALSYACLYNHYDLIKRLLSDYTFDINHIDRSRKTPLIHACNNPKVEVIELLLLKGANPKLRDNYQNNGLNSVVVRKNYQVVELLIKHGSDVNNIDFPGNTPLVSAVISGDIKMVKLLLDNGADKTIKTSRDIVELAKGLKLNEILELIK